MESAGLDEHGLPGSRQRREELVAAAGDRNRVEEPTAECSGRGRRRGGEGDVDGVVAALEDEAGASGIGVQAVTPGLCEQRGGRQEGRQDVARLEPLSYMW
ncbi:hypothetical protein BHE74_00057413 [Ensete ventricosum]|uniref:Uncharacterized protein n=1 Tax=Ensete ventricosum TaxID=4639 RepID=A0A426XR12_ENSVE|nr:hypothetical protein B296_00042517 [Ensete ventricosum]RWW37462.1 hypothetical protein BHE74_00057413 [Ensete ventricosum]